jgi:DNA-binding NarL/FixJ family response regulator
MRILLIDDEPLDLFIAKKQLSSAFDVVGFSSPKEAMDWVQQNTFDIAIIDYYLENYTTGSTILKQLQAIKGPVFKAFLLTNFIDDAQIAEMKKEGFHEVMFKPLTLEGLKEKLG